MPPRPPEATRACQLLWAVFVVSLVTLHPAIRGEWWVVPEAEVDADVGAAIIWTVAVLITVTYAVLVWLTGRRHNWARWALLVFVVGATLLGAGDFPRSLSETPAAAIADVLVTLAELWAFRLLFFGPGAEWFRQPSPG